MTPTDLLEQIRTAAGAGEAVVEIIAPTVGGVTGSDGKLISADQKIDGGPSVLYDAVAILTSPEEVEMLVGHPAARDFVADAYAHAKFVGYTAAATPLLVAAGVADHLDDGFIALDDTDPTGFLERPRPCDTGNASCPLRETSPVTKVERALCPCVAVANGSLGAAARTMPRVSRRAA